MSKQLISSIEAGGIVDYDKVKVKPMTPDMVRQLKAENARTREELQELAKQKLDAIEAVRMIKIDGKLVEVDYDNEEHLEIMLKEKSVRVLREIDASCKDTLPKHVLVSAKGKWLSDGIIMPYAQRLPPSADAFIPIYMKKGPKYLAQFILDGSFPYLMRTPFVLRLLNIQGLSNHISSVRCLAYMKAYLKFLTSGHGSPSIEEQEHFTETNQLVPLDTTIEKFNTAMKRVVVAANVLGHEVRPDVEKTFIKSKDEASRILIQLFSDKVDFGEETVETPAWFRGFSPLVDVPEKLPANVTNDVLEHVIVYTTILEFNCYRKTLTRASSALVREDIEKIYEETAKMVELYDQTIWKVMRRCLTDKVHSYTDLQIYDPHNYIRRARDMELVFFEPVKRFLPVSLELEEDWINRYADMEVGKFKEALTELLWKYLQLEGTLLFSYKTFLFSSYSPEDIAVQNTIMTDMMRQVSPEHVAANNMKQNLEVTKEVSETIFVNDIDPSLATMFQPPKIEGVDACEECGAKLTVISKDGMTVYENAKIGLSGKILCFACN